MNKNEMIIELILKRSFRKSSSIGTLLNGILIGMSPSSSDSIRSSLFCSCSQEFNSKRVQISKDVVKQLLNSGETNIGLTLLGSELGCRLDFLTFHNVFKAEFRRSRRIQRNLELLSNVLSVFVSLNHTSANYFREEMAFFLKSKNLWIRAPAIIVVGYLQFPTASNMNAVIKGLFSENTMERSHASYALCNLVNVKAKMPKDLTAYLRGAKVRNRLAKAYQRYGPEIRPNLESVIKFAERKELGPQ